MTAEDTPAAPREPPDHHEYRWVMFDRDTVTSFVAALRFYETRLEEDIGRVQNDPDLAALLDQETIDSYPIGRVRNRIRGIREWFERLLTGQGALPVVNITLNHELVRLLKSVELLYLEHLRRKRDVIASSPTTSKALLEALDQQLAKFQEKTGLGIFKLATPSPLVVDQLPLIAPADQTTTVGPSSALPHERARGLTGFTSIGTPAKGVPSKGSRIRRPSDEGRWTWNEVQVDPVSVQAAIDSAQHAMTRMAAEWTSWQV